MQKKAFGNDGESWYMKKIKPIYFITAIEMKPISSYGNKEYVQYLVAANKGNPSELIIHQRTLLWLPTYEEAEEFVKTDCCGLSEGGSNQWAVIEGIRPIFVEIHPKPQVFFKYVGSWENDTGHYEKIEGWPEQVKKYYDDRSLVPVIATIG